MLYSSFKCWHILLCNIRKITIIYATTHLVRKVLSVWKLSRPKRFPKFYFCMRAQCFLLANTVRFPWSDRLTRFAVEKMSTDHFVGHSCKCGRRTPRRAASSAGSSVVPVLFLETAVGQTCLMLTSDFDTKLIKKMYAGDRDLLKVLFFTELSRRF